MPFTPFHFGPGMALKAAAPRHFSFIAFCVANVLTDVEPLYFMLAKEYPLHRFLHTLVGATLTAAVTVALFALCLRLPRALQLPDWFRWKSLTVPQVAVGAALGTYSHILLDSLMHTDMHPFAPFGDENPLLHLVSHATIHIGCLALGLAGAAVLAIRRMTRKETAMTANEETDGAGGAAQTIVSTRLLAATPDEVFAAFADPQRLARWWGPRGFTNTMDEFDLRPGGAWRFVMHGPDGVNYKNESVFVEVERPGRIVFDHVSRPRFRMTITLASEEGKARITWRMRFDTAAEHSQVRKYAVEANEQNFDRLEAELGTKR